MPVEDGRYVMDFEGWDRLMTGNEKMLMLCSPHNPGGRVWTRAELEGVAAFAKRHDLIIVSDEIHGERGYQIVLEHANTVELQQRCLKICEIGAQMRLLYTTALYHDYVAGEIPLAELDLATGAIEAKRAIAKDSTVVLMDGKSSEAGQVVAEAIAIVSAMNKSEAFSGGASSGAGAGGGSDPGYPPA